MFDEFCQKKGIKGNYKEAFYHHLMAKYSEYDQPALVIDQLAHEVYEAEWGVVLSQIFAKVMAGYPL